MDDSPHAVHHHAQGADPAQFALARKLGAPPAVLVNSFHIMDAGGLIRLAFADQIGPLMPDEQFGGEIRAVLAMHVQQTRELIKGLEQACDFIEDRVAKGGYSQDEKPN